MTTSAIAEVLCRHYSNIGSMRGISVTSAYLYYDADIVHAYTGSAVKLGSRMTW
ncbi:hypothetical protein [Dyella silvatica]|uniref:hypothetical protein n=1 Tax=Dyella silvatica TaxID=2992128 RepID=UPI00224EE235|nr:hypothetical protein [Dyella silvatica]